LLARASALEEREKNVSARETVAAQKENELTAREEKF
jgi:hypothetical protein